MTVELQEALEKRYVLKEMYAVWHFEASTDFWKDYIRNFVKIKLETSPHSYPSIEVYAEDVKARQSIEIDLDKLGPNPVKRSLSKLAMNSLYSKFGQRQNMSQTEYVNDVRRFYEVLLDAILTNINMIYLTDEMVQVMYKETEHFVTNNVNKNIFLALFSTSNARLRLYDQLDNLKDACLYCDTDSVDRKGV